MQRSEACLAVALEASRTTTTNTNTPPTPLPHLPLPFFLSFFLSIFPTTQTHTDIPQSWGYKGASGPNGVKQTVNQLWTRLSEGSLGGRGGAGGADSDSAAAVRHTAAPREPPQ